VAGSIYPAGRIAERRGRSFKIWAWIAALIGPLALPLLFLFPNLHRETAVTRKSPKRRKAVVVLPRRRPAVHRLSTINTGACSQSRPQGYAQVIPLCSTDVPHRDFHRIAAPSPRACACGFARGIHRVLHRQSNGFPRSCPQTGYVPLTNRVPLPTARRCLSLIQTETPPTAHRDIHTVIPARSTNQ
jgi:hypothetical protein